MNFSLSVMLPVYRVLFLHHRVAGQQQPCERPYIGGVAILSTFFFVCDIFFVCRSPPITLHVKYVINKQCVGSAFPFCLPWLAWCCILASPGKIGHDRRDFGTVPNEQQVCHFPWTGQTGLVFKVLRPAGAVGRGGAVGKKLSPIRHRGLGGDWVLTENRYNGEPGGAGRTAGWVTQPVHGAGEQGRGMSHDRFSR